MNALPQTAEAVVNCRVLPGESIESVHATLVRVLDDSEITVAPAGTYILSPPSPLNSEVFEAVGRLTSEFWPGIPVIPLMSPGGTDGSFLRNAGIPTYGQSGRIADVDDNRAHGKDERILVESFYQGLEYLYRLVKDLSSGQQPKRPATR